MVSRKRLCGIAPLVAWCTLFTPCIRSASAAEASPETAEAMPPVQQNAECTEAGNDALITTLASGSPEQRKHADLALQRCGRNAVPALLRALRGANESERAAVASLAAIFAGPEAIEPIIAGLRASTTESHSRRAMRAALGLAVRRATPSSLHEILAKHIDPADQRVDRLRALSGRLGVVYAAALPETIELLHYAAPMASRYVLLEPLASLASVEASESSPAAAQLASLARGDAAWPIRAKAVELAADVPAFEHSNLFETALKDPEPRVRQSALRAMGVVGARETQLQFAHANTRAWAGRALEALEHEPWSFLRIAALEALSALPRQPHTIEAIVQRMNAHEEPVAVRTRAARTLGRMCATETTNDLLAHALRLRSIRDAYATENVSGAHDPDALVGFAALEAIGSLASFEAKKTMTAPLQSPQVAPVVRAAAERALHAETRCGNGSSSPSHR